MVETRTALVTGSMQGIGLAIARRLASQGNNLVLTGLAEEIGEGKAQAGIKADFGVEVMVCPADLASPDAIRHLVTEASGRLRCLRATISNRWSEECGMGPVAACMRAASDCGLRSPRPTLGKSKSGWRWNFQ